MSTARAINRAERQVRVLALRKDHGMSLRQIAAREGCGVETARRDLNKYLSRLDTACLECASSLRAELFEKYDAIIQALEHEVLDNGNLDRVPDLLKASQEVRKLYALDIVPMNRSELTLRRMVVTEIASKLRDQLSPETFAEIALLLTEDEPIQLLDGIAVEDGDASSAPPPRRRDPGSRPSARRATSPSLQAMEPGALSPTELVDAGD